MCSGMKDFSVQSDAGMGVAWLVADRHSLGVAGRAGRGCRGGTLAPPVCLTRSRKPAARRVADAVRQVPVHRAPELPWRCRRVAGQGRMQGGQ